MAGSVDLLQRCYTGLELCNGELWFNPSLPAELAELSFRLRYRRHSLKVDIGEGVLTVASDSAAADPITVMMGKQKRTISPGEQARFEMQPQTAQLNT
ncbi:MAG: hypothetical protein OTI36_03150 [Beijerinckiaceae bacterium]|nr:hypothetical protein [Beijerinckiaceae bacterium]